MITTIASKAENFLRLLLVWIYSFNHLATLLDKLSTCFPTPSCFVFNAPMSSLVSFSLFWHFCVRLLFNNYSCLPKSIENILGTYFAQLFSCINTWRTCQPLCMYEYVCTRIEYFNVFSAVPLIFCALLFHLALHMFYVRWVFVLDIRL